MGRFCVVTSAKIRDKLAIVEEDHFDPAQRAAEKAAARQADDEALASGRVSAAELNKRNFAFACVDFSKARIDFSGHVPDLDGGVEPVVNPSYPLSDLLADMKPDSFHQLVDFGPAVGNERFDESSEP